jgi:hypothetical protein
MKEIIIIEKCEFADPETGEIKIGERHIVTNIDNITFIDTNAVKTWDELDGECQNSEVIDAKIVE